MEILQILDTIKLPFEIPLLRHPIAVHFAIVLPIVALLLEIVNLFIRRKCVGVISSLLLLLATFVYLAAFFTGKVDGKEAYALLSEAGKEELKEHKLLGMYLVYGIGAVFLLKLIIAGFKSGLAKLFFVLVLAVFVGFVIKQGKDGGELVYEYGANVKAVSTMDDKVMELEEQLDECNDKLQNVTKPAPITQQEASSSSSSSEEASSQESSSSQATHESNATETPSIEEKAKSALEEIKGAASSAAEEAHQMAQEAAQSAQETSVEPQEQPTH